MSLTPDERRAGLTAAVYDQARALFAMELAVQSMAEHAGLSRDEVERIFAQAEADETSAVTGDDT